VPAQKAEVQQHICREGETEEGGAKQGGPRARTAGAKGSKRKVNRKWRRRKVDGRLASFSSAKSPHHPP